MKTKYKYHSLGSTNPKKETFQKVKSRPWNASWLAVTNTPAAERLVSARYKAHPSLKSWSTDGDLQGESGIAAVCVEVTWLHHTHKHKRPHTDYMSNVCNLRLENSTCSVGKVKSFTVWHHSQPTRSLVSSQSASQPLNFTLLSSLHTI